MTDSFLQQFHDLNPFVSTVIQQSETFIFISQAKVN